MGFKTRIEIDPNCENEIIIRCKHIDAEVMRLQALLDGSHAHEPEMELSLGGNDYFIKAADILFFETDSNKTSAHTKDKMYYTELKLYELEERLPKSFMRISKSCIINVNAVSSLKRELTGICEASFANSVKKVFISRSYYKPFREKINEMRLGK